MTESECHEAWAADMDAKVVAYGWSMDLADRLAKRVRAGRISMSEAARRLKPHASPYLTLRTDQEFLSYVHVKLDAYHSVIQDREAIGKPLFGDPDVHAGYRRLVELGIEAEEPNVSVSALIFAESFLEQCRAEAGKRSRSPTPSDDRWPR